MKICLCVRNLECAQSLLHWIRARGLFIPVGLFNNCKDGEKLKRGGGGSFCVDPKGGGLTFLWGYLMYVTYPLLLVSWAKRSLGLTDNKHDPRYSSTPSFPSLLLLTSP